MSSIDAVFAPSNRIEREIQAGSVAGVIAALRALPAPQRKSHASAVRALHKKVQALRRDKTGKLRAWWGGDGGDAQVDAANAALFFCGTDQDRGEYWLRDGSLFDALDLLDEGERARLAGALVQAHAFQLRFAQRLIVAGLSQRPDGDAYIVALIGAGRFMQTRDRPQLAMIDADPGLLDGALLRLFEVEGDGENNLAAADKYTTRPENTWSWTLLELTRRGTLARPLMLASAIGTLERDWPQFRAGWFSRFHDALAPTPAEMAPHAERYLALCHSRIAPTVTLALTAVGCLFAAGVVSAHEVLDALAPVLASPVKGQVDGALKLLDALVRQQPDLAHRASALAGTGLMHEAADLHKHIIARLALWGIDDALRTELEPMLAHVAAASRAPLASLLGAPNGTPAPRPLAPPVPPGPSLPPSPVGPERSLAALDQIADVVQAVAALLEDAGGVDDAERVLDALVRMAPLTAQACQLFQPVLRRAGKIGQFTLRDGRPLAHAVLKVLHALCGHPLAVASDSDGGSDSSVHGELARRTHDLIAFAHQGKRLSSLSAATHAGGYIHPHMLVERIAAHHAASAISGLAEQRRALLRLAPGNWPDARRAAAALPATAFVQALRRALGDDTPGLERHDDDAAMLLAAPCHGAGFWGERSPVSLLLYGASLWPSHADAFFAHGVERIGDNLDWWEARWNDKAFLLLLRDPATTMTGMATRLLALGLGAREPGQAALAVDAMLAAVGDGRLDALALGDEIGAILVAGLGKAPRYAKTLGSVRRADARASAVVGVVLGRVLGGALACVSGPAPRNTGALLDLLLELVLGHGVKLDPTALGGIGKLRLTGKARAVQKSLLA